MLRHTAKRRLLQALRVARFRAEALQVRHAKKPLCLVVGNCQAQAVQQTLLQSRRFRDEFGVVTIPGVHEIDRQELALLNGLFARCELLIAHPVKPNYRGLPLGTDQIAARAPHARLVRVNPLYYEGMFPFQVYVHAAARQDPAPEAPPSGYHDLRAVSLAASGMHLGDVDRWLTSYAAREASIRALHGTSVERLRERDRSADVPVADAVLSGAGSKRMFHTVNHPTPAALELVADQILAELEIYDREPPPAAPDPLGALSTPVVPSVQAALALQFRPATAWRMHGVYVSDADVVRSAVSWYRTRTTLVQRALEEHRERVRVLDLEPGALVA